MANSSSPLPARRLRCAIYTRKSSEEGLEQSFNSLDAQREACEAYVLSQTGEGWSASPARYDDGGFSGGSMERPGLQRLLADIERGLVDIVVVYKVDRLTRSLADFARIVDTFDRKGVSFVSVTQAFNTTTSMGRLTLNVLLSFAQFEREVTGERIRDKIAASKKKGMWMGGKPPLGYAGHERTLVINDTEAATVRHIFKRYIALKSVHDLAAELKAAGIVSRAMVSSDGVETGGKPLTRGPLYHLLSNQLYLGKIVHKDNVYPGQHPPIIDEATFYAAAKCLAANRQDRRDRPVTVARSPLTGLIFDADGEPLCPVSARKKGESIYRYYVSSRLQRGHRREVGDDAMRLPALEIEALVLEKVQAVVPVVANWEDARRVLKRVVVNHSNIDLELATEARPRLDRLDPDDMVDDHENGRVDISCPARWRAWQGRTTLVRAVGTFDAVRRKADPSLVAALVRAHKLVRAVKADPDRSAEQVSDDEGASRSYLRRLARLAFLAPDLQRAILEGRHGAINLERLMRIDLPLSWAAQRQIFRPA